MFVSVPSGGDLQALKTKTLALLYPRRRANTKSPETRRVCAGAAQCTLLQKRGKKKKGLTPFSTIFYTNAHLCPGDRLIELKLSQPTYDSSSGRGFRTVRVCFCREFRGRCPRVYQKQERERQWRDKTSRKVK